MAPAISKRMAELIGKIVVGLSFGFLSAFAIDRIFGLKNPRGHIQKGEKS